MISVIWLQVWLCLLTIAVVTLGYSLLVSRKAIGNDLATSFDHADRAEQAAVRASGSESRAAAILDQTKGLHDCVKAMKEGVGR